MDVEKQGLTPVGTNFGSRTNIKSGTTTREWATTPKPGETITDSYNSN